MACPRCGREPEAEDRFCRACGTPVVLAAVPPIPPTPPTVSLRPPVSRSALYTTTGLALVAFILLLAVYLVTRSSTLFFACCFPVGFAFAILLAAGMFGLLKRQPLRGDLR